MNQPEVNIYHLFPEPPSHFPLHLNPSGCHRSPGLSSLQNTAKLPLIIYFTHGDVCFHATLSLSHPLLPLLCLQVCSLHLRLHCCPPNRFIKDFVFLTTSYLNKYNTKWNRHKTPYTSCFHLRSKQIYKLNTIKQKYSLLKHWLT